jgi:hypothetical protein
MPDTSFIAVPVNTSTFLDLASFLKSERDVRGPTEIVEVAIRYWLDNASWKPEFIDKKRRGYRWKSLFLPDGTKVRMRYRSQYFYAEIVGDDFIWKGTASSPSQFANGVTSTSRNAWKDIEVMRPDDSEWYLADGLRDHEAAE